MPSSGACGTISTLRTVTPSLTWIASGLSLSSISPQCARVRRTCGKSAQSSVPASAVTCRMVSAALAVTAMRSAWVKAVSLASEKSVGWTIERISSMNCPRGARQTLR